MESKRIRLVLFSAWGSDFKEVEFSVAGFVGLLCSVTCGLFLLAGGVLYTSTVAVQYFCSLYEKQESEQLITELHILKDDAEQMALNYEKAVGVEGTFQWAGIDTSHASTDAGDLLDGRGGAYPDEDDTILAEVENDTDSDNHLYDSKSERTDFSLKDYERLTPTEILTRLESKFVDKREQFNILSDKFEQRRRQLERIPSVKPILNGRITDFFGKRVDPFVKKIRHHRGLDIAAPRNTPVYAPGAGEVEVAKVRYRINRGYGRVVIINHGYGMKTLYGHLSKVNVKKGQKVKRWDIIGHVGDTGRATGPHLHYEVWVDEKAHDPVEFIINQ